MESYIYNIPVFIVDEPDSGVDIPLFCKEVEETIPQGLLRNVEVVYVGQFKELADRNATYAHGGIYMTSKEPTNFDMLENFVHEVAHSLEAEYGMFIYDDSLVNEFKGKRMRLYHLLAAEGYHINPILYGVTEYNRKFDNFLANEVGYPTLLTLTMGLFASPYGATSIQEYFANGFEKYILDNPRRVRSLSPVLYRKIEEIINDNTEA
mgnify:CR=1 FL=1|tara:strand:- start:650 stop:1273 length:624 start_codon:yes stop_codon:yes gene_type:complete